MSTVTLERPPASADEAPAKDEGLTAAMAALAERFDFREEADVAEFVESNPDLVELLLSIPPRAAAYFPEDHRLMLDVLHDYEDEDAEPVLFALIPTHLRSKAVRERMDAMTSDWWLDEFRRGGGRINIDVMFL
jgi:hypothetical protein